MSSPEEEDPVPIGERVRFWEEQDRINQELIPRVIRQGELISEHVAEHENLQAIVADAVRQAVAQTLAEQKRVYDAKLEDAKSEMRAQAAESARKARNAAIYISAGVAALVVAVFFILILILPP